MQDVLYYLPSGLYFLSLVLTLDYDVPEYDLYFPQFD